jgi:WD40 repeat protein
MSPCEHPARRGRSAFVALLALALAAACQPAGRDPETEVWNAYLQYRERLAAGDVEGLRSILVREAVAELGEAGADEKLALVQQLAPGEVRRVATKRDGERIELVLESDFDGAPMEGSAEFELEDGGWKLALVSWSITLDGSLDAGFAPPPPSIDATRARPRLIVEGDEPLSDLVWSHDGSVLIAASYDAKTLFSIDATTGKELSRVELPRRPSSLEMLADGPVLCSDVSGQITLWPLEEGRLGEPLALASGAGTRARIAASRDGRWIASTGWQSPTQLWERETGEAVWSVSSREQQRGVAFAPDGTRFATGGHGDGLSVWDTEQRSGDQHSIDGVSDQSDASAIAWSADGRWLATGHMDSSITIWDAAEFEQTHEFYVPNASTWVVRFSPDGSQLLSGHQGGKIWVWDPVTAEPLAALSKHDGSIRALAFGPDGAAFASAGEDGRIIVWQ